MTRGPGRLKECLKSAALLQGAGAQLARKSMSHLDLLKAAVDEACVCQGKSVPGLDG